LQQEPRVAQRTLGSTIKTQHYPEGVEQKTNAQRPQSSRTAPFLNRL